MEIIVPSFQKRFFSFLLTRESGLGELGESLRSFTYPRPPGLGKVLKILFSSFLRERPRRLSQPPRSLP
jgi:hypothetical protein